MSRKNWFNEHPKFQEIVSYGFDEFNGFTSRITMMVYLELCEGKHWFDVELHPCLSIKRVFITGKPRKKAKQEIVVPLSVDTMLSVQELRNLAREICITCRGLGHDDDMSGSDNGVILGICESDSSTVYYKIYPRLEEPGELALGEEANIEDNPKGKCDT